MKIKKLLFSLALIVTSMVAISFAAPKAQALSGSDFNPGRIIDDSVFYNKDAMSVNEIQNFIFSKSGVCDTNRPTTNSNYQPPWTCLYQYRENTTTKANNIGAPSSNPAGSITAAQIIYDAAQQYSISPRALLVLIQKESSLVTDNWPWSNQYRSATGYGCPDGAPCDSQYYGFYNQVNRAAFQLRRYATFPNEYNVRAGRNNNISYHPSGNCGAQTVYVQNAATAGLYNYTPYVPNAAALNNLYGTGDGCSSYGNRNFWRLYNDWFGTVTAPSYAWEYVGQGSSVGSSMISTQKATWTLSAKNVGSATWSNTGVNPIRLGASNPIDRTSPFCTSSWRNCSRPATLNEASVPPGSVGTFTFDVQAPSGTGSYKEYFNLLAEGSTWMNNPGLFYGVTVSSSNYAYTIVGNTIPDTMTANATAQGVVTLRNDSNVAWYKDGPAPIRMGTSNPLGRTSPFYTSDWFTVNRPALMNETSVAPGQNATFTISLKAPSTPGSYTESYTPVAEGSKWFSQAVTKTIAMGGQPAYVLQSGQSLTSGQSITSSDGRYRLVMQTDGNLVLYSPNRAIWHTSTAGKPASRLTVQTDGNMVLYGDNYMFYWATWTQNRGNVTLVVQTDGNLVLYDSQNRPVWNSRTAGKI